MKCVVLGILVVLSVWQKDAVASLDVLVKVSEGLVLAADSRSSYVNSQNDQRAASDNAEKLIQVGKNTGCLVVGDAFFAQWTIKGFIEAFRSSRNYSAESTIAFPQVLEEFKAFQLANLGDKTRPNTEILFAGYDQDDSAVVFRYFLASASYRPELTNQRVGLVRMGQAEAIDRLLRGVGLSSVTQTAIEAAKVVRKYIAVASQACTCSFALTEQQTQQLAIDVVEAAQSGIEKDRESAESRVLTDKMYLQDAVDYARFLIRLSMDYQRFTDGTKGVPGGSQSIGGDIDVATITSEGFRWISRKSIK